MKKETKRKPHLIAVSLAAVCLTLAGYSNASAEEKWQFTGFFYLWGSSVGGSTTTGQDIDISFRDLLDTLDFGIVGSLDAHKGKWSVFGDLMYIEASDDETAAVGPGIPVSADTDIQSLLTTVGAGYDLVDNGQTWLSGFGGLRYLDSETTVNITAPGGSRRVKDTISNWDAVVGLRGAQQLSNRWDFMYYVDLGGGDSDMTWQLAGGFDYQISKWYLNFGYRHLEWDFDDSPTIDDMEFSGPYVGARYQF